MCALLLVCGCALAPIERRSLQVMSIEDHLSYDPDYSRADGYIYFGGGHPHGRQGWMDDRKAELRRKVDTYLVDHPETEPVVRDHLFRLEIAPGMTKDEVELLMGSPHGKPVTETNKSRGTTERWYYHNNAIARVFGGIRRYELVFQGHILSEIVILDAGDPL